MVQEVPNNFSAEDHNKLLQADILERVLLYEELIERYSDPPPPLILIRLAELLVLLRSGSLAAGLYRSRVQRWRQIFNIQCSIFLGPG